MGIFDNILKGVKEEVIRNNEQSKNVGRRNRSEDTYNHFMKTLEKTSGIRKEDIISMKINSIEKKK